MPRSINRSLRRWIMSLHGKNPCQASLLKLEHYKTPQAANRFVIRSCDMLPITRSWFLTSWSTTSILYSYQRLYYIYSNLYIEIDISYYDVFIQQLESEPGCLEPTASSCSSISLEGVLPISPYHHSSHSIVNLGCHIDVIDLNAWLEISMISWDFMRFSVMPCLWILWWHQKHQSISGQSGHQNHQIYGYLHRISLG